jgi:hypothetical protein
MKDRGAGAASASAIDVDALRARVAGAFGTLGGWFGPGRPQSPQAPVAEAGRAFDYGTGVNLTNTPRGDEPISFGQLRALADAHDITRLAIETRKDQLCKLDFAIVPKEDGKKPDDTCREIEDFLREPDRIHDWQQWLRMMVEDCLVIDAATIYPRMTNGGKLFALELIDGSTIKRVVDSTGRTPLGDEPAYQQVLKGVAATNYRFDELLYRPRNPRVHKFYGMSPVEQIIVTVNIALRRQMGMLDYFTAGTIPDALCGVPENWNMEQIQAFQKHFDSLMADTTTRRKLRFVPGDMAKGYKETKQPPEKSVFDEWLARVVCYAFSLEVTPFVSQVNRAVADTNREQALSEGLAPLQKWIASIIETIIRRYWNRTDLRLKWTTEDTIDAETQSKIDVAYCNAGIWLPDEVRQRQGKDPLPEAPEPTPGAIDPITGLPIPPKVDPKTGLPLPPEPPKMGPDGKPLPPKPGVDPAIAGDAPAGDDDEGKGKPPQFGKADQAPIVVNVTLPEMKAPDVFVDVGATTVHATIDGVTRSIEVPREPA